MAVLYDLMSSPNSSAEPKLDVNYMNVTEHPYGANFNSSGSYVLLFIFIIPTLLVVFCTLLGYLCRLCNRNPASTGEINQAVTTEPLTPPPCYDKPPSYDEALSLSMAKSTDSEAVFKVT